MKILLQRYRFGKVVYAMELNNISGSITLSEIKMIYINKVFPNYKNWKELIDRVALYSLKTDSEYEDNNSTVDYHGITDGCAISVLTDIQ